MANQRQYAVDSMEEAEDIAPSGVTAKLLILLVWALIYTIRDLKE